MGIPMVGKMQRKAPLRFRCLTLAAREVSAFQECESECPLLGDAIVRLGSATETKHRTVSG